MKKGRAVVKSGKWHIVISYKDEQGNFKQAWRKTGLEEKGNKRAAEAMIPKIVSDFEEELERNNKKDEEVQDLLFADYLEQWLENVKTGLASTTQNTYSKRVKIISADFRSKGITLFGLKREDIKEYYLELQKQGKSMRECWHRNIIIRASLYAALDDSKYSTVIKSNPAANMGRNLKIVKYQARYFNSNEMKILFEVLEGDSYEWLYKMTALYGLRRSEILGLKWSAIDFENNKIIIQHTVTQTSVGGKSTINRDDKAKNKSSLRTYPLLPDVKAALLAKQKQQAENKSKYKKAYYIKDSEYVWVDELGRLLKPDTISEHFKLRVLKKNGLPIIRFHDLRHSCASILAARGVSMKEIQAWLGHSSIKTTGDLYAHFSDEFKEKVADIMTSAFKSTEDNINAMLDSEDDAEYIAKYRQAKAEMERLGFKTLDEYEEYLAFKTRKDSLMTSLE